MCRYPPIGGASSEAGYEWVTELVRKDQVLARWNLSIDGGPWGTDMGQVPLQVTYSQVTYLTQLSVVGGTRERMGDDYRSVKRLNFTKAPKTTHFPPASSSRLLRLQIFSDGERIVVKACTHHTRM